MTFKDLVKHLNYSLCNQTSIIEGYLTIKAAAVPLIWQTCRDQIRWLWKRRRTIKLHREQTCSSHLLLWGILNLDMNNGNKPDFHTSNPCRELLGVRGVKMSPQLDFFYDFCFIFLGFARDTHLLPFWVFPWMPLTYPIIILSSAAHQGKAVENKNIGMKIYMPHMVCLVSGRASELTYRMLFKDLFGVT